MDDSIFWAKNIRRLVDNPTVIPASSMPHGERLNTLSRLIIIVSMIMGIFFSYKAIWFLVLGFLLLILLDHFMMPKIEDSTDFFVCDDGIDLSTDEPLPLLNLTTNDTPKTTFRLRVPTTASRQNSPNFPPSLPRFQFDPYSKY